MKPPVALKCFASASLLFSLFSLSSHRDALALKHVRNGAVGFCCRCRGGVVCSGASEGQQEGSDEVDPHRDG